MRNLRLLAIRARLLANARRDARAMVMVLREPRPFIMLVVLTCVLFSLAVLVNLQEISGNNHKWCQVVTSITEVPVSKPSDPNANPSRENQWELYEKFVNLGNSLGC